VFAVAITGVFSDPPAADEVPLPWHPNGASRTNLVKPCVAKCSWICELQTNAVLEVRGHAPAAQLKSILARVGVQ
jgi:hypothetical protein